MKIGYQLTKMSVFFFFRLSPVLPQVFRHKNFLIIKLKNIDDFKFEDDPKILKMYLKL